MPRTKISEFSATAASNTDIDSINIAEGCAPSGINDAIRELMAQLKDFQTGAVGDSFNGPVGSTTAAAGAFTTLTASSTLGVTGVATLGAGAILNTPASVTLTNATGLPLTTGTTGTLATTKGGTGLTSFTSGGVVYASSSSALTSGSALTYSSGTLQNTSASNQLSLVDSASSDAFYTSLTGGALTFNSFASRPFVWTMYATEQMRLTSTGLGIGTSSPAYKLDVRGVTASGNGTITSGLSYDSGGLVGTFSNHAFGILTNSTVVAKFDTSGNLGLGVTPSAWNSAYKAFDVSTWGSIVGEFVNQGSTTVTTNCFANSTGYNNWTFKNNGYATRYKQGDGIHSWLVSSASGTSGNAITFTQAMTLSAAGYLGIAETSPPNPLSIKSDGTATGNGWNEISSFRNAAQSKGLNVGYNPSANNATLVSQSGGSASGFEFWGYTGSAWAERARIDSSGNFILGGTTAYAKSTIVANASGGPLLSFRDTNGSSTNYDVAVFNRNGTQVGSISITNIATLYNTTSDQRLKENIQDAESASSLIDSLQVRQFDWKSDNSHQRYGFVAQELVTVAPEAVHQPVDADEMMAVDYSKLVPMLVKEIQSLRKRLADAGI